MRRFPIQLPAQAPTEAAGGTTSETKTGETTDTKTAETKTADTKTEEKPGDKKTETKTGGESTTTETSKTGDKADESTTQSKVPDKYEFTVPDAGKAHVEDADLKTLETIAKKAGWTQDEAQAALEEHVATMDAQAKTYLDLAKADKDYGGEKLEETQRLARLAITKIRPEGHTRRDGFMRFINKAGAGNHPEVLAFLADIGRQMQEDSPAHGAGGGKQEKTAEAVLYGGKS
jgi:hypothetical protein